MSVRGNALSFWSAFEKKNEEIRSCLSQEKYSECMELVASLDEQAYEDFGCHFFVDNAYSDFELTWDTGPNKTIQYIAQLLCDTAPESIRQSWILHASLPPLSQKAIQAQIQIKDQVYALPDFHVFYTPDANQETWGCEVYCPGFSLIKNGENKREMSIYLMELALGQCAYEAYISRVDFLDSPKADAPFCNMVDLYETLMEYAEKHGWKMYDSALDIYSVYKPIQDFAHDALRKDMKMIFTTHPLLIEESIEGQEDVKKDLEAKGGEFGYIYYDNLFHTREDALYRQTLSKKLEQAFEKRHEARVIGGAIGKSYSYIDCIVYDKKRFESTLELIKKQLDKNVQLHYQKF